MSLGELKSSGVAAGLTTFPSLFTHSGAVDIGSGFLGIRRASIGACEPAGYPPPHWRRVSDCSAQTSRSSNLYPIQEGFVDSHGALIYYESVGRGAPLLIVHGGPGASHDYFLPTCCLLCAPAG